ncbi:hypothetical protein VaNZ11_009561, partial [Volvox africanus]
SHLCDTSIVKAAAEAWQDAIILFAAFGIKLRNGLDLTCACPPSEEELQRGRKKLSLFTIFQSLFPDTKLSKDKTINHQQWFARNLDAKQAKYGALDAFVSYAAGVRVLQRPGTFPLPEPYDLTLPSVSELLLAAQWVLTSQLQEANHPSRTKHDFCDAKFESDKRGLVLQVSMSRFKTRLRKGCWVELKLLGDGRRISGICVEQKGKRATVGKLRWIASGSGSGSGSGGSGVVRQAEVSGMIQHIEMQELKDTMEAAACQDLLAAVLCGKEKLLDVPLAAGVFGAGTLRQKEQKQSATSSTSPSCAAATSSAAARPAQG